MIRELGKPVQRGEMVERIEAKGVKIWSDDKPRYIGTVLWRDKDRFVNIEGEGYWLKGLKQTHSEFDDLLGGESKKQERIG